jgi:hypothetical protein
MTTATIEKNGKTRDQAIPTCLSGSHAGQEPQGGHQGTMPGMLRLGTDRSSGLHRHRLPPAPLPALRGSRLLPNPPIIDQWGA